MRASLLPLFAPLLAVAFCHAGAAATLTVRCEDKESAPPAEMLLVYEGDASGTLKVTAPFGEASLAATKEEREGRDGDKVTGIRAFGRAEMLMPEPSGIESCIAAQKDRYEQDEGMFEVIAIGCVDRAALSGVPVPVKIGAYIALGAPPDIDVGITRNYLEESDTGLHIDIETFPRSCSVVE